MDEANGVSVGLNAAFYNVYYKALLEAGFYYDTKENKPVSSTARSGDTVRAAIVTTSTKSIQGVLCGSDCIVATNGEHQYLSPDQQLTVQLVKRRAPKVQDILTGEEVYSHRYNLRPGTVLRNMKRKSNVMRNASGNWYGEGGTTYGMSEFMYAPAVEYKVIYLPEGK